MVALFTDLVAGRTGRQLDEPVVRAFAGAVVGVVVAAWSAAEAERSNVPIERLDAGFGGRASGFPL